MYPIESQRIDNRERPEKGILISLAALRIWRFLMGRKGLNYFTLEVLLDVSLWTLYYGQRGNRFITA